MKRLPIILAAVILAACSVPDSPPPEPRQAEAAPVAANPAPERQADDCAHVGELFDLYVSKRDGEGWTEDDALDDLRGRGAFTLAYVVDGVFREGGGVAARVDTLATCRRMAKGESRY